MMDERLLSEIFNNPWGMICTLVRSVKFVVI